MLTTIPGNGPYLSTESNAECEWLSAMFRKLGRLFLKQFRSSRAQEHKNRAKTYVLTMVPANGPHCSTKPNIEFERLSGMFRKLGRLFLKQFRSSRAQERINRAKTY